MPKSIFDSSFSNSISKGTPKHFRFLFPFACLLCIVSLSCSPQIHLKALSLHRSARLTSRLLHLCSFAAYMCLKHSQPCLILCPRENLSHLWILSRESEFPVLFRCFTSSPLLPVAIPYPGLWTPRLPWNIQRFHCACSQLWGRDLENPAHQGTTASWQRPSLAVLVWKHFTGYLLGVGQRLLFWKPPSSSAACWPASVRVGARASRGRQWSALESHLLKERMVVILWIHIPKPTNFPFFCQTYGRNKEENKVTDFS